MKHLLKSIIITSAAFYIAYTLIPSIKIGPDPKNILLVIGGLFVIFQAINPIFSLVLLPINFLTFGLLTLILNVAFVFALVKFIPEFTIVAYNFPGSYLQGFIIPAAHFNQITTTILIALVITVVQRFLHLVFN